MSITGANNPFSCTPVVFSATNQILQLGTITRDGNEFTFSVGFIWKINGTTYQNTVPFIIEITEASDGFYRIDNAILNTSNSIELQQGLESETIALQPVVPDTNILLTSWNISGTTIGDTSDPIIGTSFVKKSFTSPFVSDVSGADAIIPLDPNGYSEIRLTNASLTSIAGFDLSLITGVSTSEVPYNGKPYIIRNLTGNSITIKNELGAADYPFYLTGATDLVFPKNQAIYVSYDSAGFNELFKSWSTSTVDISGKQDKVIVVSASGTASNDQKYHVTANATFTDPDSPVEGKGYEVFVRNGVAAIGGVDYPVGSYIFRTYHSGSWASQLIGGSSGELNIEVVTIQNRWTLTNVNTYYRSRGDYAGFNDAIMTITTGQSSYATLDQTQRSSSSFFYYANGAKKLHKITVDCGNIAGTITGYTLMVVACQRVASTNVATSTVNGINLGEYAMTKTSGQVSDFHVFTPNDVTIPDGYIVTCFLKRADGTAEINCSIMFQFKNA